MPGAADERGRPAGCRLEVTGTVKRTAFGTPAFAGVLLFGKPNKLLQFFLAGCRSCNYVDLIVLTSKTRPLFLLGTDDSE